jgi:hypothetical protein
LEDIYRELMRFARSVKRGELRELSSKALEARQHILSRYNDSVIKDELSKVLNYVAAIFYLRGYQDSEHHRRRLSAQHRTQFGHESIQKAIDQMLRTRVDPNMNTIVEEYIQLSYPVDPHAEATLIRAICERLDNLEVPGSFGNRHGAAREKFGPAGKSWTQKPLSGAARETIRRIIRRFRLDERARKRQQLFLPLRRRNNQQ